VAVTVGEPIGEAAAIPSLVGKFLRWCEDGGLLPCWWHVTARWLELLRLSSGDGQSSARVSQIGGYAMVDLQSAQFEGPQWRDVRAALRRLPALDYSLHWYDLAADPLAWRERLQQISQSWLARRALPEIRHSIGTWESTLQRSNGLRCLVLCRSDGEPAAFMTFAPLFVEGGGYGLDLLRSDPGLPRDSQLFMLTSTVLKFKAEGLTQLALGLAPLSASSAAKLAPSLRRLGSGEDTPLLLRAARKLAWQRSAALYNFSGLAQFKQRLHPHWSPRYVVYPSLASLPRVLRALCHVHGLKARTLLNLLRG
jgi:phosphatidylglycerol lysyltransferase